MKKYLLISLILISCQKGINEIETVSIPLSGDIVSFTIPTLPKTSVIDRNTSVLLYENAVYCVGRPYLYQITFLFSNKLIDYTGLQLYLNDIYNAAATVTIGDQGNKYVTFVTHNAPGHLTKIQLYGIVNGKPGRHFSTRVTRANVKFSPTDSIRGLPSITGVLTLSEMIWGNLQGCVAGDIGCDKNYTNTLTVIKGTRPIYIPNPNELPAWAKNK